MDASTLRRRFVKARDNAGPRPLRFHDLRHVFGSLAIQKADIVQVQTWMVHARLSIDIAVSAERCRESAIKPFLR